MQRIAPKLATMFVLALFWALVVIESPVLWGSADQATPASGARPLVSDVDRPTAGRDLELVREPSPGVTGPSREASGESAVRTSVEGGRTVSVTDTEGVPLAEARILTVPWERRFWPRGSGAGQVSRAEVLESAKLLRTDVAGGADLDLNAFPDAPHGSVVWAWKPGYRMQPWIREHLSEPELPLEFELSAVAPTSVSVVDSDGWPVFGASVEVRLPVPPALPFEAYPLAIHACCTFALIEPTDADGRLALPGPPMEALEDRLLVRSWHGGRCSHWKPIAPGESAVLQLTESFELAGTVSGWEELLAMGCDVSAVRVERELDGEWETVGQVAIDGDGTFGVATLPFRDGARHRAWIDAPCSAPLPRVFEPRPGARSELALESQTGLGVPVLVEAIEGGLRAPFRGSYEARAEWGDESGPVWAVAVVGDGSQSEFATIPGVPPGVPFELLVNADGWCETRLGPFVTPQASQSGIRVEMTRASTLTGQVRGSAGEVATLLFVVDGGDPRVFRRRVRLDAHGHFELRDAPAAEAIAFVVSEAGQVSRPVEVSSRARAGIVFDLPSADGLDRCAVVDANDGRTVGGLSACVRWKGRGERSVVLPVEVAVDHDGGLRWPFEGPVTSSGLRLCVGAEGYLEAEVAAGTALPDVIALEPRSPLRVRLVDADGFPAGHEQIDWIGRTSLSSIPDTDGSIDLSSLPPDRYEAQLHGGSKTARALIVDLPGSIEDGGELVVEGAGALEVRVAGGIDTGDLVAYVESTLPGGNTLWLSELLKGGQGQLVFDGVGLGSVSLQLESIDRGVLVHEESFDLEAAQPHMTVLVDLAERGWDFEVVDAAGAPVGGAEVAVVEYDTGTVAGRARTDADGLARVFEIQAVQEPEANVSAIGRGACLEFGLGQATTLDGERAPIRVELASNATLELVVTDGLRPIEGAVAVVSDWSGSGRLAADARSDSSGRCSWKGLAPGTALVWIEAEGYVRDYAHARLVEGPTAIAVELQPATEIEVRVGDLDGVPLSDP